MLGPGRVEVRMGARDERHDQHVSGLLDGHRFVCAIVMASCVGVVGSDVVQTVKRRSVSR